MLLIATVIFALLFSTQVDAVIYSPAEGDVERPGLSLGRNFVKPADWPAVLAIFTDTGRCSGTIVGERAILTAAHCVKEDGVNSTQIGGLEFRLSCEQMPAFEKDPSADFALCETQSRLPDIRYIRVGRGPARSAAKEVIAILGYGCRSPGGVDRSFGALTIGYARVAAFDRDNFVVKLEGSVFCNGDGGGPTLLTGDSNKHHVMLGVNSRSDNKSISYSVLTSSSRFLNWAKSWSKRNKVEICGLSQGDEGCRRQSSTSGTSGTADVPVPTTRGSVRKAAQDLNQSSTDLIVVSFKAGESVDQIVERTCGPQPLEYYDFMNELRQRGVLSEQLAATDANLSIDSLRQIQFSVDGELNIPECQPAFPDIRKHTIQGRDDPYRLYELVLKKYQPEAAFKWLDFKRPNNVGPPPASLEAKLRSPYFLESFRALNPELGTNFVAGKKINLPIAPAPPSDPSPARQKAIPRSAPAVAPPAPPKTNVTSGDDDELGNFAMSTEELKRKDIELQSSEACESHASDAEYPYNVRDLLGVLARNRDVRNSKTKDPKPANDHYPCCRRRHTGRWQGSFVQD